MYTMDEMVDTTIGNLIDVASQDVATTPMAPMDDNTGNGGNNFIFLNFPLNKTTTFKASVKHESNLINVATAPMAPMDDNTGMLEIGMVSSKIRPFLAIQYPAEYRISLTGYRITEYPANRIFSNTFFSYL